MPQSHWKPLRKGGIIFQESCFVISSQVDLGPTSLFLGASAEESTKAGSLHPHSHVGAGFCPFAPGPLGALRVLGHSEWWGLEQQVTPSGLVLIPTAPHSVTGPSL